MGEYSDDDLDDLPESALRQLEDNAIRSTQAPLRAQAAKPLLRPNPPPFDTLGLDDDDDLDLDFEDSDVLTHSVTAIPQAAVGQPAAAQAHRSYADSSQGASRWNGRSANVTPAPQPNRMYANAGQGVPRWNGRAPNAPANAARPNANPPFRPPSLHSWQQSSQSFRPPAAPHNPPQSQFPRGFAPPPHRYAPSQSQAATAAPHQHQAGALAAPDQRLRALEAELNVSRGEAAILRANSTKAQRANEAEIARLLKLAAEQEAKHERALQAAVQAERATATELQFVQREMREVAERARRKDPGAGGSGTTTPRKGARTWGLADGFDGMDLVPSPTKALGRTKSAPVPAQERTPTRAKRKRPLESPVPPLDTTEESVVETRGPRDVAPPPVAAPAPAPGSLYSLPFDVRPCLLYYPLHTLVSSSNLWW